jgi:hypothetical protein
MNLTSWRCLRRLVRVRRAGAEARLLRAHHGVVGEPRARREAALATCPTVATSGLTIIRAFPTARNYRSHPTTTDGLIPSRRAPMDADILGYLLPSQLLLFEVVAVG